MHSKVGYFSPNNFIFWIIASLFIKVIYVTLFFPEIVFGFQAMGATKLGLLGYYAGDTPGYFDPIENLLQTFQYEPDYRMPGYGAIYLVIRIFMNKAFTLNAVIFIQLFTSALSFYCLAQSAYLVIQKRSLFYLTFLIYSLSMRSSYWDFAYLTESFTVSFLIFSTYFLVRFYISRKSIHCFLSGFFLTWAIFIRPVYLPLYFAFTLTLILMALHKWKMEPKKILVWSLLYCSPFLFLDGLWIIRNYSKYKSLLPLTKSFYVSSLEESYLSSLMNFVISYGGDRSFWNAHGEIRWYLPESTHKLPPNLAKEPGDFIYTSQFSKDSLLAIKRDIAIIEDSVSPLAVRKSLNTAVKQKLERYTKSIKEEKPSLFYATSRIAFLKKFLFHSGTDFLPPLPFFEMHLKQQFLKLSNTFFYLMSIVFGSLGCVYILLKYKIEIFVFAMTGGFSTIIYPILGHLEPRYFFPAYPFLLVCALYFLNIIFHNLNFFLNRNEKIIHNHPGI